MRPSTIAAAITTTAAILLTAGCVDSYHVGGIVDSKETDKHCTTNKNKTVTTNCHTEYEIDLILDDGTRHEVKARTSSDYDHCQVGERFPQCTDGKPQ